MQEAGWKHPRALRAFLLILGAPGGQAVHPHTLLRHSAQTLQKLPNDPVVELTDQTSRTPAPREPGVIPWLSQRKVLELI